MAEPRDINKDDASQKALRQVEAITESGPVNGEDLLGSDDLKRQLRAAPWTDWLEVLKSVSPLAEWEEAFLGWRKNIVIFRQIEQESFFPRRDETLLRHVHRGWLGELISDGEKLAVDLLRRDPAAKDQMEFLNLCLENLQNTLEVWHSAQTEPIRAVSRYMSEEGKSSGKELKCECGNTFIEHFGDAKNGWWVGCKPCGNHVHAPTRYEARRKWRRKHEKRDDAVEAC